MELIEGWSSFLVVFALLALMMGANEIGYRLGIRLHRDVSETSRTASNTLKASVFGLVALVLAFSFSMTASRHEDRRRLVLDEANGIGTCYLRAGLLPEPERTRVRESLRQFVDVRLEYYDKALDANERLRTTREMDRLLAELWFAVESAVLRSPETAVASQIVPAANAVIDMSGTRASVARNHVPAPVFALLLVCVAVSSLLMGHSSGQSGQRHIGLWAALNVLLALLLFVMLDFDRPRQGFIRVDHAPLIELQASIQTPTR